GPGGRSGALRMPGTGGRPFDEHHTAEVPQPGRPPDDHASLVGVAAVEDRGRRAVGRDARRDRITVRGPLEEEFLLDVRVRPLQGSQLGSEAEERIVVRRIARLCRRGNRSRSRWDSARRRPASPCSATSPTRSGPRQPASYVASPCALLEGEYASVTGRLNALFAPTRLSRPSKVRKA